uniref:Uncharacterized protein n=1 Tax=Salix viminalis TaxID=40686 RepID=A0A6N2MNQ5_SALVM
MEPTSNNSNCVLTKEEILVQIESRNHSAAAILCQCYRSLLLREPQNHLTEADLPWFPVEVRGTAEEGWGSRADLRFYPPGIKSSGSSRLQAARASRERAETYDSTAVASKGKGSRGGVGASKRKWGGVGLVGTSKLSRILAELLGEDQMLAVVCRSKETASAFAQSISGRFLVMCLEDIRPYTGELECGDPQRKLKLSDPTLQSGNVPSGFIGETGNLSHMALGSKCHLGPLLPDYNSKGAKILLST